MGQLRHCRSNEFLRRVLVAGCVALVFALGVFAASPVLHDQLHHATAPMVDDGCSVVLFANGLLVPLAVIAAPPPPVEWGELIFVGSPELLLDSPRYRLQPGRGPPVG